MALPDPHARKLEAIRRDLRAVDQRVSITATAPAYVADVESTPYTGAADSEAKLADLEALRAAYENLRAYVEGLATYVGQITEELRQ